MIGYKMLTLNAKRQSSMPISAYAAVIEKTNALWYTCQILCGKILYAICIK